MNRLLLKKFLMILLVAISWSANAKTVYNKGNITMYVGDEKKLYHSCPSGYSVSSNGWFLRETNGNSWSDGQENYCLKIVSKNSQSCTIKGLAANDDSYLDKYELHFVSDYDTYECYWTITVKSYGNIYVDASPAGSSWDNPTMVSPGSKVYLTARDENKNVISDANIYYTTDGSWPTENSTLYNSSGITINGKTNLQAIAQKYGYNPVICGGSYDVKNIDITSTNFPDENFRNWILESDFGQDGKLTEVEIKNITSINVRDKNISTLKGIEFFTSLKSLECGYNQLTSLDVSKNTALTELSCWSNQLTSLDVSKNTALTELSCGSNPLTALDVSKNTALTKLSCYSNQLTALDVSKNTVLEYLYCNSNQLTSLDISKNTALTYLSCSGNQLTSLDVSNCTALRELYCNSNQLTSLDVSNCTALTILYCQRNQIKGASMDAFIQSLPNMSTNPKFRLINNMEGDEGNVCTESQVAAAKAKGWTPLYNNGSEWVEYEGNEDSNAIDITSTNFPDENFRNWILERYYGKDGKLTEDEIKNVTSIDVNEKNISTLKGIEYFTSLKSLYCNSNQLFSLDVSKNTALTLLYCNSNQLTSLDVSQNTALTRLMCSSNQLTSLDVSKNTALTQLVCGGSQLTSLDVSKNTALTELVCASSQLTSFDVSMNTALEYLNCYNNQLTSLDVSKNTTLTELVCGRNQINGKAMDDLISSLPYNSTDKIYEFHVISPSYDNEGNVCTKSQVAAAKAKGWVPYYLVGNEWQEYEGSDEHQYAQGDVNMDEFVNGTDLVALSNIILGRKEQTETADVNDDGSVNGTDIVALSNIILGRGNKAPHRASATASLSVNEDFDIKAGEEKELFINLTNPNNEVTRVQLDLHLPEGLTIKKIGNEFDFDMAGRTTWRKHTLDVNEVDGAYRFLLYSSSNTLIEGTNGAIIKMTIVADGTFKGGMLSIDNSLLVGPDESETKPEAYEYMIGVIPDDGSAKLSLKPFDIKAGETKEMLIELKNPNDEITLVQFDLHLPEGLAIKKSSDELDFDMAGRTTWRKHTLDANEVDGAYRFLLYSSSNTLIEGTSGAIIKMTVTASQEVNGQKIVMDNTLLVSPDEKETKPASYKYVIGTFAKGDVNGDGDIGIGDIITITNVMASNETDADAVRRADVNGDGEVGIGDIISITNIMAGQ